MYSQEVQSISCVWGRNSQKKSAFIGSREYQTAGLHEVISVKAILRDRNQYCLDQLVFGKIMVCTKDRLCSKL